MSKWMAMAMVGALAGCAGVQTAVQRDVSGHWVGEIDRDGRRQPVSLDIERDGASYRAQLRPVNDASSRAVAAQGDEVRFESEDLRFVGHLNGDKLSGVVTDKRGDAPLGELSATQAATAYSPGSEWSPPAW